MAKTSENPDRLVPAVHRREIMPALQMLLRLCHQHQRPIILQVTGVQGGEGASTMAEALATQVSVEAQVAVLLVTFDANAPAEPVNLKSVQPQGQTNSKAGRIIRARMHSAMLRSAIAGRSDIGLSDLPPDIVFVVLDTEPLLTSPEAAAVGPQVDGVIVVASKNTSARMARKAADLIDSAGGTALGLIVNRRRYRVPRWIGRIIGIAGPVLDKGYDQLPLPPWPAANSVNTSKPAAVRPAAKAK